jgi:hypothetical protein
MSNYSSYVVTGVDRRGKRFRLTYKLSGWAFGINLWKGSVWEVSEDGSRKLLKRVHNY